MKVSTKLFATCAIALLCTACATNDKDKGADSGKSSRKGPPAEAFTACKSLSVGASCTVSTPRGEMTGSCTTPPKGNSSALACTPAGGKR